MSRAVARREEGRHNPVRLATVELSEFRFHGTRLLTARDACMMDKIRDERTDKVSWRVAAWSGSGEADLILMLIE